MAGGAVRERPLSQGVVDLGQRGVDAVDARGDGATWDPDRGVSAGGGVDSVEVASRRGTAVAQADAAPAQHALEVFAPGSVAVEGGGHLTIVS